MQMLIRGQRVDLKDRDVAHVERRLSGALDRFLDRVRGVTVRLEDVNGPKGGADKRCCVRVDLNRSGMVLVEHTSSDLLGAVDQVADRLKAAVARRLGRGSRWIQALHRRARQRARMFA